MDIKKPFKGIKIKILIGLLTTILISGLAIYIVNSSSKNLLTSIQYLAEPNSKLIKLNTVLNEISASENNFRAYLLTDSNKYFQEYKKLSLRVQNNLDSLKEQDVENGRSNRYRIDNIITLWEEKKEILQSLNKINKKKDRLENYKKIPSSTPIKNDSTKAITTQVVTTTTTITQGPASNSTQTSTNPREKDTNKEENTKGNFWGTVKEIFSKKKIREEAYYTPTKQEITKEIKVKVDSVTIIKSSVDSAKAEIQLQVQEQKIKQGKFQKIEQQFTGEEFELIQKNNSIHAAIKEIITNIKNEELRLSSENVHKATLIAEGSLKRIISLGLIAIVISIALLGLIILDISKSNYYKLQLIEAKQKAEELAKTKEEFLSNMSHEIRTPLNAIIGLSELLSQGNTPHKHHLLLNGIQSSSDHLLSIVNDILDFSKLESGKVSLEDVPFNIKNILSETFNSIQHKALEKKIEFVMEAGDETDIAVAGDPLRLRQILYNLLSNAVKFTNNGTISLTCDVKEISSDVITFIISVRDTGLGIPDEKINLIFEKFNQGDSSVSRKFGGTGLGLSITKRLVDVQGGKINVQSKIGEGSIFKVEIPYKKFNGNINPIITNIDIIPKNILHKKKALVVDDDELNLFLIHTILKKAGTEVTLASSGNEAYSYFLQDNFDFIITDLHMPEISGIDFIKLVRAFNEKKKAITPILLITADVYQKNSNLSDLSHVGLLLKPFKESDLIKKVLDLLNIKISFSQEENLKSKIGKQTNNFSYDISEMKKISGEDKNSLNFILSTLHQNTTIQIDELGYLAEKEDWIKIKEILHKMAGALGQIDAINAIFIINEIQRSLEVKSDKKIIKQKIKLLIEESKEILELVKDEICN